MIQRIATATGATYALGTCAAHAVIAFIGETPISSSNAFVMWHTRTILGLALFTVILGLHDPRPDALFKWKAMVRPNALGIALARVALLYGFA